MYGIVVKYSQVLRGSLWLMIVRTDIVGWFPGQWAGKPFGYIHCPALPHEEPNRDLYEIFFISFQAKQQQEL